MRKYSGWIVAGALAAFSLLVEIAGQGSAHAESIWHRLPGFDLAYGVLGSFAIFAISKGLGKLFLQRPEDYYSDEGR